jgi:group I intron endonuclease
MNNANDNQLSQTIRGWSRRGGIYLIKCIPKNKAYIGSAGNVLTRLKQHYHLLKANRHPNKEMQADFNQNGDNTFVVEFVKLVHQNYNRKQLFLDEQDYLDVVKSFDVKYYNKSHHCKTRGEGVVVTQAVKAFIQQHVDPYHCSSLTCDTYELNGQTKTVIAYQFQDQIMRYHTITH